jgi:subtilisin family serine protease
VAKLKIDPDVEYAEPNYIKKAQFIPNDPLYSQQWSHQKAQAPDGWDIETGKPNVIVAIIDTGVDYNHQDLAANIWHDPAGNPGADFVDIDTAEYVKSGYTLITEEDYTAQDNEPMDFNGHGTHCAGIACGVGNNGLGISGVAQHCKIMPIRAGFSIRNGGTTYGAFENDDISNSIVFAASNGADVISMSFGGSDKSIVIEDAVKYAVSKNVTLVAAAGNEHSDQKSYPAAYNDVISVGAIDQDSKRAVFSNYGTWIDVMAPGVGILSTVPLQGTLSDPSGYKVLSGTSMACPYTAGLAALIKSSHNDWTSDAIKKRIYICTIPGPDDYFYGFGIVNIFRAVSPDPVKYLCARISSPDYYPSNNVTNRFYKQFSKNVIIKGTVLGSDFAYYTIEAGEGANPAAWFTVGVDLRDSGAGEVADDVLGNWDISNIPDGVYAVKLTAFDIYGKSVATKITIIVNNSIRSGWPQDTFAGQGDFLCSPVIEDIDGDGKSEILIGSYGGLLYAWHDDGSPVSGWPVFVGGHMFTPSIGDVDNDGSVEIVAASPDCSLIFRNDGTPYSGEWPKKMSSTPALADIDGDGDLEILAGDGFYHMCAWHHTGQSVAGWPVNIVSSKIHAPAVGDIDGDGGLEVVAAEEAMSGTQVVGNVYAWHSNGALVSGNWPVNVSGGRGHPVMGDINNDGKLEIVLNTNAGLFAFRGNGYVLPYWPKVSSIVNC